jgi:hypothetical protein
MDDNVANTSAGGPAPDQPAPETKMDGGDARAVPPRPLVFISHRHNDAGIAKAIGEWIIAASLNSVDIFLSSDGLRGAEVARSITEQIRGKVAAAAVLIAVYTDDQADWAWVMFEIGIAMDPTLPQTSVVILQCGDDFPSVLSDFKRVRVAEVSDRIGLARDFLTTEFFPTHPGLKLATLSGDDFIRGQADHLWSKLEEFIPPPPGRDWSLHPTIKVDIPLSELGALAPADADRIEAVGRLVREHAKVAAETNIESVFAVQTLMGFTLERVATELALREQNSWIDSFVDQLTQCLFGHRPVKPMRRLSTVESVEYQPLIVSTHYKRFERKLSVDVLFVAGGLLVPYAPPATTGNEESASG